MTPAYPSLLLRLATLLLPCVGLFTACAAADPSAARGNAGPGAATAAATDYEPQRGQAGKDVVWVPTPDAVVSRMLAMAEVTPQDFVIDLGSGDGKIVIAAARERGARARGLEYNPDLVALSKRRAQEAGVAARVEFLQADIFKSDFSDATVITMYLLPGLNLRLRETLFGMKPGTRVVSHSFDMGAWEADERATVGSASVYLWIIPANASGLWRVNAPRLSGAPQTLRFEQQFQKLSGEAEFTGLKASATQAQLDGARLSFTLRDERGELLQFSGEVAGDRIAGTVSRGGGRGVPFEAQRQGTVNPIGGLQPNAREAGIMGDRS